jgi:hypothetical protein
MPTGHRAIPSSINRRDLSHQDKKSSCLDGHVAHAAEDVVAITPARLDRNEIQGMRIRFRTESQLLAGDLDVSDEHRVFLEDGIHVVIASAVASQRIVVAIDKQGRAGQDSRMHRGAVFIRSLEEKKASPVRS